MVTILIEDQSGACGQGLEAVHHGRLPAVLEPGAQLHVHQQLDRVAVLAGPAGAVDLDGGDLLGGGVGVRHAVAQAAQGLPRLPRGREDDGGGLGGAGGVEVLLQELAAPLPQEGALAREGVLQLAELRQEGLQRRVPGHLLGRGGVVALSRAQQNQNHQEDKNDGTCQRMSKTNKMRGRVRSKTPGERKGGRDTVRFFYEWW